MTAPNHSNTQRVAELLRALPPVPPGWVQAAQELPLAAAELDQIVALAEADAQFRRAVLADLESAVRHAGFHWHPLFADELQRRLVR